MSNILENMDPTLQDIKLYLGGNFAGMSSGYSHDYGHLDKNWKILSSLANTTPKCIIYLNEFFFNGDDLNRVCEHLTKKGYCIRRRDEFLNCTKCNLSIPCREVWLKMKEKRIPVPENWQDHCQNC